MTHNKESRGLPKSLNYTDHIVLGGVCSVLAFLLFFFRLEFYENVPLNIISLVAQLALMVAGLVFIFKGFRFWRR